MFKKLFKKTTPPEILIEKESPLCPLVAIVEQDERVAYLYIHCLDDSLEYVMRPCWIRNLKPAPEQIDTLSQKKGLAPMLSQSECAHPDGLPELIAEDLSLYWLEEGDAVALFEGDVLLAIIPGWANEDCMGYTRDSLSKNGLYHLKSDFQHETGFDIATRAQQAREYWTKWDPEIPHFSEVQTNLTAEYESHFGEDNSYFAINIENYPPRGLLVNEKKPRTAMMTVGVSLYPMPVVEMNTENRVADNRIELGFIGDNLSENMIMKIAEQLSLLVDIPWDKITFLNEGHTLDFQIDEMKYALLTQNLSVFPKLNLPKYRHCFPKVLWVILITEKEFMLKQEIGSEAFIDRLNTLGDKIFDLNRAELS